MRFGTVAVLAAATLCLTAGAALAQDKLSPPPGASSVTLDGAATSAAGRPLYFYDKDEPGVSKCLGQCTIAWPPLTPGAGAAEGGGWSILTRPDGSRQWAYKDRPVYVFYRDKVGGPPTGANLIPGWRLAK